MAVIARVGLLIAAFAALSITASMGHAAAPIVYHSPSDDGVAGRLPTPVEPNTTQTLHLYIDGGATPSGVGSACLAGSGDELCAWQVTLDASGDIELLSFAAAGDAVHTITSVGLRTVGGDAVAGSLGPTKLGDLSVETGTTGALAVGLSKGVGAALALRTIDARSIVTIPEPDAALLLSMAFASLFTLSRRRARRAPIFIALLLLLPALAQAADTDGDGIDDAQDNCPYWSNAGQGDAGGLDTATPDGIGDACQCGDVSGDGIADLRDVARIDRAIAQLAPALFAPQKCPADAAGICTPASFDALRDALIDPEGGLAQTCLAANPLQSCGNGALDIGEQCDDDGIPNGDCCTATCTLTTGGCSDGDACTASDQCSAGICTGAPVVDSFEANDTQASPVNFGTIADNSEFPHAVLSPSINPAGDIDWFRFTTDDGFGVLAPRADLTAIPVGRNYDLCLYYRCLDAAAVEIECGAAIPAQRDGLAGCCGRNAGNASESVTLDVDCDSGIGGDNSGDVFIVVESVSGAPTCTPYSLSFGDD